VVQRHCRNSNCGREWQLCQQQRLCLLRDVRRWVHRDGRQLRHQGGEASRARQRLLLPQLRSVAGGCAECGVVRRGRGPGAARAAAARDEQGRAGPGHRAPQWPRQGRSGLDTRRTGAADARAADACPTSNTTAGPGAANASTAVTGGGVRKSVGQVQWREQRLLFWVHVREWLVPPQQTRCRQLWQLASCRSRAVAVSVLNPTSLHRLAGLGRAGRWAFRVTPAAVVNARARRQPPTAPAPTPAPTTAGAGAGPPCQPYGAYGWACSAADGWPLALAAVAVGRGVFICFIFQCCISMHKNWNWGLGYCCTRIPSTLAVRH
jgi:hypothetical protein